LPARFDLPRALRHPVAACGAVFATVMALLAGLRPSEGLGPLRSLESPDT
jgi:hypothetical protein